MTVVRTSAVNVRTTRVLWRRIAASHLDRRLMTDDLTAAAWGGLQDSAPRAALLALHARVRGVEPSGWEHPALAQIWFRWADYVVPRDDLGVFTVGTWSRDPERLRQVKEIGDLVVHILEGQTLPARLVGEEMERRGVNAMLLRASSQSGRILIRWDARSVSVIPSEVPDLDPEDARRALARRFLHWLGPADSDSFAKWAGVHRSDARETWQCLASELVNVTYEGKSGQLLEADVEALCRAVRPRGVRLLPLGDPLLYTYRDMDPGEVSRAQPRPAPAVPKRQINSLSGRILVNGVIAGAWGRVQERLTLLPWNDLSIRDADRVTAEAEAMHQPIGRPMKVRWLQRAMP